MIYSRHILRFTVTTLVALSLVAVTVNAAASSREQGREEESRETANQKRSKSPTHWTLSTNLLGYVDFGTLNLDASVGVARNFTVHAGVKYNPWIFNKTDVSKMTYDKHRTFYAGMRWWPWFIYSGWWIGGKLQYEEYGRANFLYSKMGRNGWEAEEGDQFGAAFSAGYTFMLHKNLNMDIGVGVWGGYKKYTVYACPECGRIIGSGGKAFFLPSDLIVSLVYVF